jgi:hypothetical protein
MLLALTREQPRAEMISPNLLVAGSRV